MVPPSIHSNINNKFLIFVKSCSNAKFWFTTFTFALLFKWNSVITEFRFAFDGMTRPTLVKKKSFRFRFPKIVFDESFFLFFRCGNFDIFYRIDGYDFIIIKTIRKNVFFWRQISQMNSLFFLNLDEMVSNVPPFYNACRSFFPRLLSRGRFFFGFKFDFFSFRVFRKKRTEISITAR